MQGNRVVLAILRSRAHRLLSGVAVELRYHGRKTGREYSLPVQYARLDDRLVVRPQKPDQSKWWRNFRDPGPVTVRMAGHVLGGTARVVEPGAPDWETAHRAYTARWKDRSSASRDPLVVITFND
jgi:deazaflavin-dependent oxidoreductase (nitroreductase family)